MATETTVGKLLLKHYLPKAYHDFIDQHELDKKNIGTLFDKLAKEHPDQYKSAVSNLARLGFEISTRMGSTVRLTDLLPLEDKEARFQKVEGQIAEIRKTEKDPNKQKDRIAELWSNFNDEVNKDLVTIGVQKGHTLAKVVKAGARGSPVQYRQTVFSPVTLADAKGKLMPDFIVKRSFAEGLSLPEYLAHTFGSRQGTVSTKLATADAGYLSKQLSRAAMTLKIEEHDCGTEHGIEITPDDKDYIGAFLAQAVSGYNRNNEVTPSMLADLKGKHVAHFLVRSPITCESSKKHHEGAICQLCAGKRERHHLSPIGDYIGITAGTTLGEPLNQGVLNVKHTSGSAQKHSSVGGFQLINQLFNIPGSFKGKAPVAPFDGKISEIKTAPQGGHYIYVTSGETTKEVYAPEGQEVIVKKGQEVEAGSVMTDGIPNPAEIIQHKGIGEGRVHFAKQLKTSFDSGGMGGVNKRNFDVIARAHLDHVKITNKEGLGDYLPGQVAQYHSIVRDYQPRNGSTLIRVDQALGKYLEQPVLHYTIGTRITKSVVEYLKKHGVESVMAHSKEPDFAPEMQRLLDVPIHEHDWMHHLYSTNLERRLIHDVNTGATSDIKGASPIAGLAYGVGFGKKAEEEIEQSEAIE